MSTTALDLWAPRILSILRIVAALIFFEHGTQKLLGFPPHANPPAVLSLSWIAGALELVGGALLILGYGLARSPSSSRARWPSPTGSPTRQGASFRS